MQPSPTKLFIVTSWSLRLVAAAILVQTLFFKFTGAPESVYIFTRVGQEPWGRYGSGVVELLASILLFIPRTLTVGALLAAGTMSGAVFFHLTKLGIVVQDDGGLLFALALVVLGACGTLLAMHRRELPIVGVRF
jgi:putative oxidoreductase